MSIKTATLNGVATIEIARPEKKNAITIAMYQAMADALLDAQLDSAVRAILITGQPGIFTSGNDLEDFMQRPAQNEDSPVFQFMKALTQCDKPVVAAVTGAAIGIGTTLLLHCDFVYVSDEARLALPFVSLGLVPEFASSLLLPRLMGYHRAAEALLLGEPFMAEAALEVGLVNRVVPPTECNAIAQAQARKLAAKPIASLVETKRLMKLGQEAPIAERMAEEGASFGRMLREPAAREAFAAFMGKR